VTDARAMTDVLQRFADQFNRMPEMPRMTAGWDRQIAVRAVDAGWACGVAVASGRMEALDAAPAAPQIVLEGESDVLAGIFRGEVSPTEPYLDGTLRVQSTEEDLIKLDVFTLLVWGE
jgi:putative sterol carrier protein